MQISRLIFYVFHCKVFCTDFGSFSHLPIFMRNSCNPFLFVLFITWEFKQWNLFFILTRFMSIFTARNATSARHHKLTLTVYDLWQGWAIISHEGSDLEKTVEVAGRRLIGKQGEDLFFGDHNARTNVISENRGFQLVFYSNFAPLRFIFWKSLSSMISKEKKGLPLNSR